jgi:hypothetical protein
MLAQATCAPIQHPEDAMAKKAVALSFKYDPE